jgi:cell wall-associated NlpC family hydrolase
VSGEKPWWLHLLEVLAGLLRTQSTEKRLEDLGAGAKVTFETEIEATFSEPIAAEEFRARAAIVTFMREQLGKSYKLGAEVLPGHEDEASSWDCSEAVEAAYRLAGRPLPDGAQQQFDACQAVVKPMPGDLGFLWSDARQKIGHVMVAAAAGTVIHAVSGRGVVEDPVSSWEHHPRWRGWRRHVDFARPPEDRA